MTLPRERNVAVYRAPAPDYPDAPPFSPGERYPEAPFGDISSGPNEAYRAVRECLALAGLDRANAGTSAWNPLGGIVRRGDTVLLKPNLVKEFHPRDPDGWRYVLTHGSIIRACADYVALALRGNGRIVLGDAPQTDSSFRKVCEVLGLGEVADFYRHQGVDFELVDFRQEEWVNEGGVIIRRERLPGDPNGNIAFDLA